MKLLAFLAVLALTIITVIYWYSKKTSSSVTLQVYGPFTIKMELFSQYRFNGNLKLVKETNVSYSVWYKDEIIQYPDAIQNNTGYSHLWRVYILGGAPKPTLIAGSQSLFLITENDGKPLITRLNVQANDFASLQFLDENNGQPGLVKNVYMSHSKEDIETLKGGNYLFINSGLILHVPDLTMRFTIKQNQEVNGFYFMKAGGAVAYSPDKNKMVFMGGKNNQYAGYYSCMIVCDCYNDSAYTVEYDRTETRSIDLNENNREWFKTYFEWVPDNSGSFKLKLRKYDVLPYWQGLYKDNDVVYNLKPVKKELQQVFLEFIFKQLSLSQNDLLPPEQYSVNSIFIKYKDFPFTLWYYEDGEEVMLMIKNSGSVNADEQVKVIHELGDAFNNELNAGKYQQYFTTLK